MNMVEAINMMNAEFGPALATIGNNEINSFRRQFPNLNYSFLQANARQANDGYRRFTYRMLRDVFIYNIRYSIWIRDISPELNRDSMQIIWENSYPEIDYDNLRFDNSHVIDGYSHSYYTNSENGQRYRWVNHEHRWYQEN